MFPLSVRHCSSLSLLVVTLVLIMLVTEPLYSSGAESSRYSNMEPEHAAAQLLKEAEHFLYIHQAQPALPYLQKVLNEYPDTPTYPWAKLRLAEAYHNLQQWNDCMAVASRLAAEHPNTILGWWGEFYNGVAILESRENDYEAVQCFIKIINGYNFTHDQGPLDGARVRLAEALKRISLYDPAFGSNAAFLQKRGLDMQDTQALGLALEATVAVQLGDLAAANKAYETLLHKYPQAREEAARTAVEIAFGYLAWLSSNRVMGEKADKLASYRGSVEALLLTPRRLAKNNYGLIAKSETALARYQIVYLNNAIAAETTLREMLKTVPASDLTMEAWFLLGWALQKQGKHHEALIPLQQAASWESNSGYRSPAQVALVDSLLNLDRTAEALMALNELANTAEGEWMAVKSEKAALIHRETGNLQEAASSLNRAAEIWTSHADQLTNLLPFSRQFQDKARALRASAGLLTSQVTSERVD